MENYCALCGEATEEKDCYCIECCNMLATDIDRAEHINHCDW